MYLKREKGRNRLGEKTWKELEEMTETRSESGFTSSQLEYRYCRGVLAASHGRSVVKDATDLGDHSNSSS